MDNLYAQVLIRFLLPEDPATTLMAGIGNSTTGHEADKPMFPILKLLPSSFCGLGSIIVMTDANSNLNDGLDLRLHEIKKEDLDGYLFANFFAHKMFVYRDLIAQIALGNFNRKTAQIST